jgi:hypothetical protein
MYVCECFVFYIKSLTNNVFYVVVLAKTSCFFLMGYECFRKLLHFSDVLGSL